MNRLPLTSSAAALFRTLAARAGLTPDRTLLSAIVTTDWHSLTLDGERHQLSLRLTGPDAATAASALGDGLEDAEFAIPGWIVADIALQSVAVTDSDGSVVIEIEALTIRE